MTFAAALLVLTPSVHNQRSAAGGRVICLHWCGHGLVGVLHAHIAATRARRTVHARACVCECVCVCVFSCDVPPWPVEHGARVFLYIALALQANPSAYDLCHSGVQGRWNSEGDS